jgi:Family of unknown function (DUF5924)/Protein of unknown function (DUF2914)
MNIFKIWHKFKETLLKHEKVLWLLHSVWALTFGILIIVYFHGDFGQVRKLILYLMGLLLLLIIFDRVGENEIETGKNRRGIKLVLNYVMKNMYQALYFFMIPFYWEASVLDSKNMIFTGIVGVLAILSTQDLIFDNWLMERKPLRAAFYSFCLFSSFNLLLPLFLPLPIQFTLPLAAFLGIFGFVILHYPKLIFKNKKLRWVVLGAALVAGGCYSLRSYVPPAPYKISKTTLTAVKPTIEELPEGEGVYRIHEKDIKTKTIYCAHILESPVSPKDDFVHVWYRNNNEVYRKKLNKKTLGKNRYLIFSSIKDEDIGSVNSDGEWKIILSTTGGQKLNKRSFLVVK